MEVGHLVAESSKSVCVHLLFLIYFVNSLFAIGVSMSFFRSYECNLGLMTPMFIFFQVGQGRGIINFTL